MSPKPPSSTRVRKRASPKTTYNGGSDVISSLKCFEIGKDSTQMTINNVRAPGNTAYEKQHKTPRIQGLEKLRRLDDEEDPEVAEFFRLVLEEGTLAPGDSEVPIDDRPLWLDERKLRLGQRFAQKYFSGLMMAEMLSLFLLFASPGSLQPLIFSGNSDTPLKASRRYLSTVRRVRAWYRDDLWAADGEASCHLRAVRHLHALYRRRLRDAAPAERARRTALSPPLLVQGAAHDVRRDFAACAAADTLCPFLSAVALHHEWINQMEMTFTQWGFLGLMVTYPESFGAGSASQEELDGFVLLWRTLGHLLGVQERFNFCTGGLDAVRKRTRALLRHFVLPALANVGDDWEHMSRCVVEGTNMYGPPITFEVALLYLCETVGAQAPHVLNSLTAQQLSQYSQVVWVMRCVLSWAPLRAFLNWRIHKAIDGAQLPPLEIEAKFTTPQKETPRREGPPMWLYTAVFFFVVFVQIIITLTWATQKSK